MCGNNTLVNNVGHYFKYTGNSIKDDKDTISDKIENVIDTFRMTIKMMS